jgi:transaldolase
MDANKLSAHDLEELLRISGVGDLLVNWSADQIELARREGKIPTLASWKAWLTGGQVGLDALMNLAGLGSFAADQQAMDQRIRQVLEM